MNSCGGLFLFLSLSSFLVSSQYYNVSTREWDRDFKKNKWSFIDRVAVERGRNSLIINIFYALYGGGGPLSSSNPSQPSNILDVGCGEGVLSDFLVGLQRQHYYGVDISSEAIKSARKRRSQDAQSSTVPFSIKSQQFQVASALEYTPPPGVTFGAIVFNEMLYYTDYSKVIQRYMQFLDAPSASPRTGLAAANTPDRREKGTPYSAAGSEAGVAGGQGGVIIISIWYSEGNERMKDEIFAEAKRQMEEVDFMDLSGVSRNGAGPNAVKRKVSFRVACFRKRIG